MTTALAAIEPYQPVSGIPMREALARAHGHIERTQRFASKILEKHEALKGVVDRVGGGYKKLGVRALNSTCSSAIGTAIGVVDGRFGGERGYATRWGFPLDWAVGFAGHGAGIAALAFGDNEILQGVLHAVGDAGFTTGSHRWGHELGVAWAQKANAAESSAAVGANANGAKGGAVYTIAHPK